MLELIGIGGYGLIFWLGLYLLGRNRQNRLLALTGTGLLAYALGIACSVTATYWPVESELSKLYWLLFVLPAVCWTGALPEMLPEEMPLRATLLKIWRWGILPLTALFYGLAFFTGLVVGFDSKATLQPGSLYPFFALLIFLPMLGSALVVGRYFYKERPRQPLGPLLLVTLFFLLSSGLMLFPFGWLPLWVAVLSVGIDVGLLGVVTAVFDAFNEGETLRPDMTRSFIASLFYAFLFSSPLWPALFLGWGAQPTLFWLMLGLVSLAIISQVYAAQISLLLDRLAFAASPQLRQAREEAGTVAEVLPRINTETDVLTLDETEFIRLTRRALSNYGNLERLATNPLTQLPQIENRLKERRASLDPLERATELKKLLAEGVARLKPHNGGEFGTSDEWRYYNSLYFPYILGLKPYSRRQVHSVALASPTLQAALDWFRDSVPERTLHNWQNTATKLIARDLRDQTQPSPALLRQTSFK